MSRHTVAQCPMRDTDWVVFALFALLLMGALGLGWLLAHVR